MLLISWLYNFVSTLLFYVNGMNIGIVINIIIMMIFIIIIISGIYTIIMCM